MKLILPIVLLSKKYNALGDLIRLVGKKESGELFLCGPGLVKVACFLQRLVSLFHTRVAIHHAKG